MSELKLSFLSTANSSRWLDALAQLAVESPFFHPEYHRAFELNGSGESCCFLAEEGCKLLVYPVLKREIVGLEKVGGPWFDIETLFGNTGPLANTTDPEFLGRCWDAFSEWCQEQSVISEFVRLHPFKENRRFLSAQHRVFEARKIVSVPIAGELSKITLGYADRQRRCLKQALSYGLVARVQAPSEGLDDFKRLYFATMERVSAPASYLYDSRFFDALAHSFRQHLKLISILSGREVIAAGLFFKDDDILNYFLAGNNWSYEKQRPTNLLLHSAVILAQELGCVALDLGGGRTAAPDDSLLKFKLGLSSVLVPSFVATKVHNQEVYQGLCQEWRDLHCGVASPAYFQLYRLP